MALLSNIKAKAENIILNVGTAEEMTVSEALDIKADKSNTYTKNEVDSVIQEATEDLGTASQYNAPAEGHDAAVDEVVIGSDSRLTDSRDPNPHTHTVSDIANLDEYIEENISAADVGAVDESEKGEPNGVATLDSSGHIPSSQLPGSIDEIVNGYYNQMNGKFYKENTYTTEILGEENKIYVSLDTNIPYRWSGLEFVVIPWGLALGTTHETAAYGDEGQTAYYHATGHNASTSATLGLYKVAVNNYGHIIQTTAVTKEDITNLGIPGEEPDTSNCMKIGIDYVTAGQSPSLTLGNKATAEGYNTVAYGDYSHAEGNSTYAAGNESHAEGWNTSALGNYGHAEGSSTYTDGGHAEGEFTTAYMLAHAEGNCTFASAGSHAEGDYCYARYVGHAEGNRTSALGNESHAEGGYTCASGNGAHAEGGSTTNWSLGVYGTFAIGENSHSEGLLTYALGECSHASGFHTTAKGNYQTVVGKYNEVDDNGDYAFIVGNGTATTALSNALGVKWDGTVLINGNPYSDYVVAGHAEGIATTDSGNRVTEEGYKTYAHGDYAHAEGFETTAHNYYSHAEGDHTYAGNDSTSIYDSSQHAEGTYTTSCGQWTHAEGWGSYAQGVASHAEGRYSYVTGDYSHAEGFESSAIGEASHVECYNNIAQGKYSHAEGLGTYSNGHQSHTEGYYTNSYGLSSHAEGGHSISQGSYSHAEGYYTSAYGNYSHAEGQYTSSIGVNSHAEGKQTYSYDGHAEGVGTSAYRGSHAEGNYTYSTYTSHAEGENTTAKGTDSHAEGYQTCAYGKGSHAEGFGIWNYEIKAAGKGSHAEGCSTSAIGNYSHAEGNETKALGIGSHAEGGYSTSYMGGNTIAYGMSSHAEGVSTSAMGEVSHAEGYQTYACDYAHAEGYGTSAKGAGSHTSGEGTVAQGTNQMAIGKYNIIDTENKYAFIIGNGDSSVKSNLFTVSWDGDVEVNGQPIQTSMSYDYSSFDTNTKTMTFNIPVPAYNTQKILRFDAIWTGGNVATEYIIGLDRGDITYVKLGGSNCVITYSYSSNTYTINIKLPDEATTMNFIYSCIMLLNSKRSW